jgi:hypothetical protein
MPLPLMGFVALQSFALLENSTGFVTRRTLLGVSPDLPEKTQPHPQGIV